MALTGVLRPGYIQIRALDIDKAIVHYDVDRVGLHEVSREPDGRGPLQGRDFDVERAHVTLGRRGGNA